MAAVGTLAMQELAGGTRIVLPMRVLPVPLRQFARGAILLGIMLVLAGLSPLFSGIVGGFGFMHALAVLAGWVPTAVGVLLLRGHSFVDCVGGNLIVGEQAGLVRWRRRFELHSVKELEVAVLPLNFSGNGAPGVAHESITILAGEIAGRGRRVLLFGYPAPLLDQVITEMRRRSGWVPGRKL